MRRVLSCIAALAMLAGALPSGVAAAPLVKADAAGVVAEPAVIMKVHGCHFDLGPNMAPDHDAGPHYHDRQCRIVRVGPQRGYGGRDYYDEPRKGGYRPDYDDRPRRPGGYSEYQPPAPPQPACFERCRYVGPIKRCRTVCE